MLRNYLAIYLRKFLRHPIYALINITGLVLGLTCSIFIFLWVRDEWSYNKYHEDNDRVFKVLENQFQPDGITTVDWTSGPIAETLRSEFPEVAQASRFTSSDAKLFRSGEKAYYENGDYADGSLFEVLNLPLAEGNLLNPLPDNQSIAISKKMAAHYFDHVRALGKTLHVNNGSYVTITAVFEDLPENITKKFDFILPILSVHG